MNNSMVLNREYISVEIVADLWNFFKEKTNLDKDLTIDVFQSEDEHFGIEYFLNECGYYEFDVQTLRPGECRWLSTGMLIKPVDGEIEVNYRIHSDHSSGNLSGELKWLSIKT
jgi:hypothetical protein